VANREPKPTINDVARLAGVSKKTVSRVINNSPLLNDATRDKVTAVIRDLGYVPNPQARALALRRNFLIGLIHDNPNAQMVLSVQEGMLDAMKGTEFALVVRPVDRKSPHLFDDIRHFIEQQRLYGIYVLPPVSENDEVARLCAELGCRYVRMGSARLDDEEHLVESNDREAVREAVDKLIRDGHTRIGHVAGPDGFRSAREREAGLREALLAHGLSLPDELRASGNYTFDSGYTAAKQVLSQNPRARPRSLPLMTRWPPPCSTPHWSRGWKCRASSRFWASTIRRSARISGLRSARCAGRSGRWRVRRLSS